MKRVIGIGNALTDMLVNLKTDKVLDTFNLPKGSMSLVDAALQTEISKSVAGLPYSLSLGGSAGNTIRAMARLGCDVGFIGKVGTDKTGDFFIQALENLGIEPFIFRGKERSGRCVSLISPDGERTMVTFLGAALELSAAEVTPAIFEGYDCLYIEGYLVQDHELIAGAVRTAKACGLKVATATWRVSMSWRPTWNSALAHSGLRRISFCQRGRSEAFTGEGERSMPCRCFRSCASCRREGRYQGGFDQAGQRSGPRGDHGRSQAGRYDGCGRSVCCRIPLRVMRGADAASVRYDRCHRRREGDRSGRNDFQRGGVAARFPAGRESTVGEIPVLKGNSYRRADCFCYCITVVVCATFKRVEL